MICFEQIGPYLHYTVLTVELPTNVDLHEREQGDKDEKGSSRPQSVGRKCIESFKFNSCCLLTQQYFTHKNMDKAKLCLVGNLKIKVKWIVLSISNSLVFIAVTGILSRIFLTQWRKLELIFRCLSRVTPTECSSAEKFYGSPAS